MSVRSLLRAAWRYSWVVTLPVLIAFVAWWSATRATHRAFRVEQATLEDFNLRDVGAMQAGAMLRRLQVDWTRVGDGAPLPGLRTLDLFVAEADLAALDADLPHSGFEFVEARLGAGGRAWRVEVRYRGDNVYHWGYPKKSFRIKTDKDDLFEGLRLFNLIVPRTPELLNNYLAYQLARQLGLLAPRVELVELRVNGKVRGVHVLTEQLEETTLRLQDYMPGDLYSGDAVAMRAHAGIDNDLFRYPGLWEKQAANNHYPLESRAPLETLLACLRAPASDARHRRLGELCDFDAFATFALLEILCATIHVDTEHNWRLFYDANRCRFVPVVWDLFGWDAKNAPAPGRGPRLDVLSSPLHVALHADGNFLWARQRALAKFYASGGDRAFLAAVDRAIAAVTPAVARDPYLTMQVRAYSPAQIEAAMRDLRAQIAALFGAVQTAYLRPTRPVEFWRTPRGLGVAVSDRAAVAGLQLAFAAPVAASGVRVRALRAGQTLAVDVAAAVTARGSEVAVDVPLLPRYVLQIDSMRTFEVKLNRAELAPASYELEFDGALPPLLAVQVERSDGTREHAVEAAPRALDLGPVWLPMAERAVPQPLHWQGLVELRGVTFVDRPLSIAPGTTLRLAPGASVVMRARVLALGTAAEPIRVEGRDAAPWGVLALQGRGADGSVFRHCVLRAGSGLKTPLYEYSAMLSLHDVHGVVLEHCLLADSKEVDDMLHTVYASVRMRDCRFVGSRADAVDLDISSGVFERCVWERSGNDGIDLMTSTAEVLDCAFVASGDKGVSVGEGSRLLMQRSRLQDCNFGVQAKDGSVATLLDVEATGNQTAIDAYLKNWRYGAGGRVFVYGSRLRTNRNQAQADARSRVVFVDCTFEPPPTPSRNVELRGQSGGTSARLTEELALQQGLGSAR